MEITWNFIIICILRAKFHRNLAGATPLLLFIMRDDRFPLSHTHDIRLPPTAASGCETGGTSWACGSVSAERGVQMPHTPETRLGEHSCQTQARQVFRMTLATAERLFWHRGAHAAEPESAPRGQQSLTTKISWFSGGLHLNSTIVCVGSQNSS